jgi:ketosteroid isomerase-like protein
MDAIAEEIIAMEKAALNRWGRGDPDGFLEICASDVVYFDPYLEMRVNGLPALTQLYDTIRGQVRFDRFELLNPQVQASGDIAVLTFNYVSYTSNQASRWNCTEVYRRESEGRWWIIQTHWSYTNVFKYHKR